MDLVLHEVNRGLSKKENKDADIKCYVTYIQDLPNGKGNLAGKFLFNLIR